MSRFAAPHGKRPRWRWPGGVALSAAAVWLLAMLIAASPASAASPPSVESESASNITPTDATLGAEINLHEAPNGVYYQFQLVTDPGEYASEILCPPTLEPGFSGCVGPQGAGALPIGFLPGNTLQPGATLGASLDLASAGLTLHPGTTYHYRVLVAPRVQTEDTIEWEPPTVYGADQTFTTPVGAVPLIESESVSHITATDATLEAQINTEGLMTSYEFHLVGTFCQWPCESPVWSYPLPSGKLLGSFVGQSVSLDLNSAGVRLGDQPLYEYWITATNAAGTAEGQPQSFTTSSQAGANSLNEPSGSSDPRASAPSQLTSPNPPSLAQRHRGRDRTGRDGRRHRRAAPSRTLVSYRQEGGIKFRHRALIVSARGQATVRPDDGQIGRFRLGTALRRRLRGALGRADLHAIAGDYPSPNGAADEITEVIAAGHDTVRFGGPIPAGLRQRLEPLVDVLQEIVGIGERRESRATRVNARPSESSPGGSGIAPPLRARSFQAELGPSPVTPLSARG